MAVWLGTRLHTVFATIRWAVYSDRRSRSGVEVWVHGTKNA